MSTRWEVDAVGFEDKFLSVALCGVLRVVLHQCAALNVKGMYGKTSGSKLSGVSTRPSHCTGSVSRVLKSPVRSRSIPSPKREHSSTDALVGGGRRGYDLVQKVDVLNLMYGRGAGEGCFIGLFNEKSRRFDYNFGVSV